MSAKKDKIKIITLTTIFILAEVLERKKLTDEQALECFENVKDVLRKHKIDVEEFEELYTKKTVGVDSSMLPDYYDEMSEELMEVCEEFGESSSINVSYKLLDTLIDIVISTKYIDRTIMGVMFDVAIELVDSPASMVTRLAVACQKDDSIEVVTTDYMKSNEFNIKFLENVLTKGDA